jgi:hypothetical protein
VRLAIFGATGRMGLAIVRLSRTDPDVQIVGAVCASSDPGLGRDVAPPNGDPSTCSFETFWGPDQNGVVTDHLGRIACIEQSDSTALVWTRDSSSVLTRVEGFSPEVVYQHFQQYSGATQPTGA